MKYFYLNDKLKSCTLLLPDFVTLCLLNVHILTNKQGVYDLKQSKISSL